MRTILLVIIIILVVIFTSSCSRDICGSSRQVNRWEHKTKFRGAHECPFSLCPYKGRIRFRGVIHTGTTKVDRHYKFTLVWNIDKLHFCQPSLDYDTLDSLAQVAPYRCKISEYMKRANRCVQGSRIYYKHYRHYHLVHSPGWSS